MGGAEGVDLLGREGPIGLVGADRLVLRAVVAEKALDVLAEDSDHQQVSDEDRDPYEPLDQVEEQVALQDAILDQAAHCSDMPESEAMALRSGCSERWKAGPVVRRIASAHGLPCLNVCTLRVPGS